MSPGRRSSLIAAAAAVALLSLAPAAAAKTFEVTRTGDEINAECTQQRCSLRDALNAANFTSGKDTVLLRSRRTYPLTLPGTSEDTGAFGDLDVLEEVTIRPDGKKPATIDARGIDRVLDTYNLAGTLKLSRLVIRGGDSAGVIGGGVLIRSGKLILDRSKVLGNVTPGNYGGGVAVYGGSEAKITRSTIAGNTGEGGGVAVGPGSSAAIVSSTIAGNEAFGNGGGIFVGLGGNAELSVENSTITANRAGSSGGGIISATNGTVSLVHTTVVRNRANLAMSGGQEGGGIAAASNGPLAIRNSIVALNEVGTGDGADCGFPAFAVYVAPSGKNLVGDADRCGPLGTTPNLVANPKLGPLTDNGGPTPTIALKKGSPAIDAGARGTAADQRGVKRKRPDIGAYEYVAKKKKKKRR